MRFSRVDSNGTPAVTNWQGLPLYYYKAGQGFEVCATDLTEFLTSTTGTGQCYAHALLFMWALAMNGIDVWTSVPNCDPIYSHDVSAVQIQSSFDSQEAMLINNWGLQPYFNNPIVLGYPYVVEFNGGGDPMDPDRSGVGGNPNGTGNGNGWGDIVNKIGVAGQNSPTPSEKLFDYHYIVAVLQPGLLAGCSPPNCGPYFDPSYAVTYHDAAAFQFGAVFGYAVPSGVSPDNNISEYWGFRLKPIDRVDVTLTPTSVCSPQ